MSIDQYCKLLHGSNYGKNDQKWFPKWIRRYAETVTEQEGKLFVVQDEVVRFSQMLRDNGTPAWQRLQAVRAIEAYRDLVLETDEPSLRAMRMTLSRIAKQERAFPSGAEGRPGIRDERKLIGVIDPEEPHVLQQMRKDLRLRGLVLETERAYVGWVERFMRHCGSDDPRPFGGEQIRSFLTGLAAGWHCWLVQQCVWSVNTK